MKAVFKQARQRILCLQERPGGLTVPSLVGKAAKKRRSVTSATGTSPMQGEDAERKGLVEAYTRIMMSKSKTFDDIFINEEGVT
eukprot:CAMPEP_0117863016 /NCGR_PEP_ID=MMETSP0950-20121206/5332_1 /TAXON_ID=44440 /ORGANISM="Chattonella subsalsa, Strain CCMP2191" /LENGTH=83 /DNA_ID=CAMNT_0005713709 /DNA_START=290 /DNA_END=539 /DNA_ORIENTATION=-